MKVTLELKQQVKKIISIASGKDIMQIDDASRFEDLGIDSLGMIELISSIEDALDVGFSIETIMEYPETVGGLFEKMASI